MNTMFMLVIWTTAENLLVELLDGPQHFTPHENQQTDLDL